MARRTLARLQVDQANRSFAVLVAVALAPVVLVSLAGCGLLGLVGYRLATGGISAITSEEDLRPAVALLGVLSLGAAAGAWSFGRQLVATRRLSSRVAAMRIPGGHRLEELAEKAGLPERVVLLAAEEPFSFAYGTLLPRVAISQGLLGRLSDTEAVAVLAHERYHVRALDPLKVVLARTLAAAFFFLPVLTALRGRYVAGRELAADRRAIRTCGRRAVAGALYHATAGPRWAELAGAAAIGGHDVLDDRVSQLETGEEPALSPLPRPAVVVTAVAIAAVMAALAYTLVQAGGPSGLMPESMRGGMSDEMDGTGPVGGAVRMVLWAAALGAGWLLWRRRRRRRG